MTGADTSEEFPAASVAITVIARPIKLVLLENGMSKLALPFWPEVALLTMTVALAWNCCASPRGKPLSGSVDENTSIA